jgi:RNA polymerase primary sigma factor
MKPLRINQRFTERESKSFKQYLTEISEITMFTPDEEFDCALKASKGDKQAIEELIKRNLRFVVSMAKQYETPNIEFEDLVNEGNIGLIMAVENYKPDKGFKFISYAVFWVRKLILEFLSKNGRLVRLPSNKVIGLSKLNKYVIQLEQKLGKTVDISEIIEEYGEEMSDKEIKELQTLSSITFQSLDSEIKNSESGASLGDIISDDTVVATDYMVSSYYDKKQLNKVLDNLKPRDKYIISLLFGLNGSEPLTLKEVGEEVGLTREMVRQIQKNSLKKLKNYV